MNKPTYNQTFSVTAAWVIINFTIIMSDGMYPVSIFTASVVHVPLFQGKKQLKCACSPSTEIVSY